MKIRGDFVTNSSSTSFVIVAEFVGLFPIFMKDQLEFQQFSGFKNFLSHTKKYLPDYYMVEKKFEFSDIVSVTDLRKSEVLTGRSNIFLEPVRYHPNDGRDTDAIYYNPYKDPEIKPWFNPDSEVITAVRVNCSLIGSHRTDSNRNEVLEESLEIIKVLLKDAPNSTYKIFYRQWPDEMDSGGWDGGDPMGEYAWSFDCIAKESKQGMIIIRKVLKDDFIFTGEIFNGRQNGQSSNCQFSIDKKM